MGCFDFTYADNGENIRGRNGYIYITKTLQKEAKLPNPIPFDWTDEYGRFNCRIKKGRFNCRIKKETIQIDIYALYAAMLYLNRKDDLSVEQEGNKKFYEIFLRILHDKTYNRENACFVNAMDSIRSCGIEYFCRSFNAVKSLNSDVEKITTTVKPLGNQHEKTIWYDEVCFAKTPLLISKKKLPQEKEDDLSDIALKWGFVTGSDPNQGFSPTQNLYYRYIGGIVK